MSTLDMSTPLYCQYFTAELEVDDLAQVTETLKQGKQVADTILSMSTAALYNHVISFTGPQGLITEREINVLTAFNSMSVATAPVRVTFVTLADTYGNRAGLTRIQGGESARGLIPLTRSVNEATVADMSATTPGLTINLPNNVHDDLIIRCTTFDPDGCVPEAKDEFPGVDYCPSLYHLLRDEPSPGIDITHDIIRALLPYRGIHMEVEPRILDGDVDIERL
ncbi:hypothetical protein HMPREF2635_00780 [Corynebacterium sp. HMSC035E02]|uniref:hypothetical protein n=1 Tax=Corynebacterium sp. HMSC035E02 TaxID=1715114 RepID=UPI0008A86224|nr:hypothetical protein [Corynebacterium sp. HMSC035E02]OHO55583.1 hypothetical protein HMPREF2635_00780 [Corynebacterium sp. HMSC035E02]